MSEFDEFYSDVELEAVDNIGEELMLEAESTIEAVESDVEVPERSPEEKIQDWAEEKATKAIERGKEITDWRDWLSGWRTPRASEKKQLFMYHYTRTYLERAEGLEPEVADAVARGLAGLTFRNKEWEASLYSQEALSMVRPDSPNYNPTVREIYESIWGMVRRESNYYISMTPDELSRAVDIIATGKASGASAKEAASKIAESITRLSPRSLYFNLYYISRITGDEYIASVARELGRIRRR